jgi:hypothetical protein
MYVKELGDPVFVYIDSIVPGDHDAHQLLADGKSLLFLG